MAIKDVITRKRIAIIIVFLGLACLLSLLVALTFAGGINGCVADGETGSNRYTVPAKPSNILGFNRPYNHETGSQISAWEDFGLRTDGSKIIIKISGAWAPWGGNYKTLDECDLPFKPEDNTNLFYNMCLKVPYSDDGSSSRNCICEYKYDFNARGLVRERPLEEEFSFCGVFPYINSSPNQDGAGVSNPVESIYGGSYISTVTCSSPDRRGSPIDCSGADQKDPNLCTCTTIDDSDNEFTYERIKQLKADDKIYHINLNYRYKHIYDPNTLNSLYPAEGVKLPEYQKKCRYRKGLGLYAGLFGVDGNTQPKRVYHLYSEEEVCDTSIKNGNCGSGSEDMTKYIYRSPDQKIWVKEIRDGQKIYHQENEVLKLLILDRWYHDNTGFYNIDFVGGVKIDGERGLLAEIVHTVESAVLGDLKHDGTREGGVIRFLYESIIKDTIFVQIVNVCLILYVTFFGVGVLAGIVEISRKEVMKRVMKVALLALFIQPSSWEFYNMFVLGFFKYGMDSIIAMILGLMDRSFDSTAMMELANSNNKVDPFNSESMKGPMALVSYADSSSRFAYIDTFIKKLFSHENTTKLWGFWFIEDNAFANTMAKIGQGFANAGVNFINLFGAGVDDVNLSSDATTVRIRWGAFIYVPMICLLMAFFLYVMLTAALVYVTSMLKLVFVIALGPIFMVTSLFSHTESIFKKWISFMSARSLEIIILFAVLYTFLLLIIAGFEEIFYYGYCVKWAFMIAPVKVVVNKADYEFLEFIAILLKIGSLLYLLKMLIDKIPPMVSNMVQISGTADSGGGSASAIANNIMGNVARAAQYGVTKAAPTALRHVQSAAGTADKIVARALGIKSLGQRYKDVKSEIPFRNPISIARDLYIDNQIKNARRSGQGKGLSGISLEEHIRKKVTTDMLGRKAHKHKNRTAFLGTGDADAVAARLDKKLVQEPLGKFIKKRAKELKKAEAGNMLFGADMRRQLKEDAKLWANSNLSAGAAAVDKHLQGSRFKRMMKEKGELTSSQAAKKFTGDPDNANRYLDHLNNKKIKNQQELTSANGHLERGFVSFKQKVWNGLGRKTAYNPDIARKNFLLKWSDNKKIQDNHKKIKESNSSRLGKNFKHKTEDLRSGLNSAIPTPLKHSLLKHATDSSRVQDMNRETQNRLSDHYAIPMRRKEEGREYERLIAQYRGKGVFTGDITNSVDIKLLFGHKGNLRDGALFKDLLEKGGCVRLMMEGRMRAFKVKAGQRKSGELKKDLSNLRKIHRGQSQLYKDVYDYKNAYLNRMKKFDDYDSPLTKKEILEKSKKEREALMTKIKMHDKNKAKAIFAKILKDKGGITTAVSNGSSPLNPLKSNKAILDKLEKEKVVSHKKDLKKQKRALFAELKEVQEGKKGYEEDKMFMHSERLLKELEAVHKKEMQQYENNLKKINEALSLNPSDSEKQDLEKALKMEVGFYKKTLEDLKIIISSQGQAKAVDLTLDADDLKRHEEKEEEEEIKKEKEEEEEEKKKWQDKLKDAFNKEAKDLEKQLEGLLEDLRKILDKEDGAQNKFAQDKRRAELEKEKMKVQLLINSLKNRIRSKKHAQAPAKEIQNLEKSLREAQAILRGILSKITGLKI